MLILFSILIVSLSKDILSRTQVNRKCLFWILGQYSAEQYDAQVFGESSLPTIVTAHIFCACQGSRARPERNAQHTRHEDWLCFPYVWEVLVISRGKNASFFNRWKIISIYLVSSLKTEEVCACCYFCRMIDLTEHFKSVLKNQNLPLQDVTLGAWALKCPLRGKDL